MEPYLPLLQLLRFFVPILFQVVRPTYSHPTKVMPMMCHIDFRMETVCPNVRVRSRCHNEVFRLWIIRVLADEVLRARMQVSERPSGGHADNGVSGGGDTIGQI